MNCCFCGGNMVEDKTTYFEELKNTIVIIKNVPCHKCSQCGEVVYNALVVERLQNIVKRLEKELTEIAVVNYTA